MSIKTDISWYEMLTRILTNLTTTGQSCAIHPFHHYSRRSDATRVNREEVQLKSADVLLWPIPVNDVRYNS